MSKAARAQAQLRRHRRERLGRKVPITGRILNDGPLARRIIEGAPFGRVFIEQGLPAPRIMIHAEIEHPDGGSSVMKIIALETSELFAAALRVP